MLENLRGWTSISAASPLQLVGGGSEMLAVFVREEGVGRHADGAGLLDAAAAGRRARRPVRVAPRRRRRLALPQRDRVLVPQTGVAVRPPEDQLRKTQCLS